MSDQPTPTPSAGDVWAELIEDESRPDLRALYEERRQVGLSRYGVPLQRGNGRDMGRDLREELLDAMAYAQAMRRSWLVEMLRNLLTVLVEDERSDRTGLE